MYVHLVVFTCCGGRVLWVDSVALAFTLCRPTFPALRRVVQWFLRITASLPVYHTNSFSKTRDRMISAAIATNSPGQWQLSPPVVLALWTALCLRTIMLYLVVSGSLGSQRDTPSLDWGITSIRLVCVRVCGAFYLITNCHRRTSPTTGWFLPQWWTVTYKPKNPQVAFG